MKCNIRNTRSFQKWLWMRKTLLYGRNWKLASGKYGAFLFYIQVSKNHITFVTICFVTSAIIWAESWVISGLLTRPLFLKCCLENLNRKSKNNERTSQERRGKEERINQFLKWTNGNRIQLLWTKQKMDHIDPKINYKLAEMLTYFSVYILGYLLFE